MKITLIGDAGINCNGDIDIAKQLIDNIKKYKWDYIKFQKRNVEIVIPKEMWHKKKDTPWGEIKYIDYKKHLEFNKKQYDEIDGYCKEQDVRWFASAWDLESQEFLDSYDLEVNKIASPMLTYTLLVEHVANQGKLTYVSTGGSTIKEIDTAVNIFKKKQCPFVLMHCVGLYPCPSEHLNINRITTLRNRYSCRMGYSGHSRGAFDAVLASVLGVEAIEKHITINRTMFGSDQPASLEREGMAFISKRLKHIPVMLGDGENIVLDDEKKNINRMRWWNG